MYAIQTTDLCKRFPGGFGVRSLCLNVPVGCVYGFLGPNGAGKTTTVRMLLDLLRPDAGQVRLFGAPLSRNQREPLARVGALVESPSLYQHLSGRQNLEVTRRLLALPATRIDEVLEQVGLREAGERRVREYSLGMRQRLALALSLLPAPRLLILDEPTNGLDPAGILDMRRLLRDLATQGVTIFVSSHLLSEVEVIAHHVGVLQAGQLRFQGTLEELRARARPKLQIRCDDPVQAAYTLAQAGERVSEIDAEGLKVQLGGRNEQDINRLLVCQRIGVSHLAREVASLESLFFALTEAPDELEQAA
ncbi:ABC transporter ATP-binding protein [Pseudoxanthomonas indica]|uniref:ABC-2 type transport system ATP-binding protein n=1 Tax=Pseudoxanthomonas indica TaxID=428993 RepID=A0A1T5JQA5_9GAMM|nr:ATP-binding cassette domain-containing protein [Pseudoxanthomonas indica]GGD43681.1 ABC transporter ATP-binding protein [Pseudoxanthomonas indica]SKC53580.1 ABC-2 type transport system ATP-binding protein [Pseudoxanthomonas indica]